MNTAQLKEVNDLENKLKGRETDFLYVIPGFSGKSLLHLCNHLQTIGFDPNEVIPFLHTMLSQVGLGWCIPKSLSQSSKYDDFANKFEDVDMKTIRMRSFVLRVYHEFDDDLRLKFRETICAMLYISSENYTDIYKLFQYIENIEYIHSKDESGLEFFFSALRADGQYQKVFSFAKKHILNGMSIEYFEHFGQNYSFM